jgi:hypothetical protein
MTTEQHYGIQACHSVHGWHKAMVLARYSITAQYNNLPCTCCLAYSRPSTHNKLPQHFLCKFSCSDSSPASFSKSLTRVTSHPPQFHLAVAGRSFFLARSTHCAPWTYRPLELRVSINTEDIRTVSTLQIACISYGKLANGPRTQERGTVRLLDLLRNWLTANA